MTFLNWSGITTSREVNSVGIIFPILILVNLYYFTFFSQWKMRCRFAYSVNFYFLSAIIHRRNKTDF